MKKNLRMFLAVCFLLAEIFIGADAFAGEGGASEFDKISDRFDEISDSFSSKTFDGKTKRGERRVRRGRKGRHHRHHGRRRGRKRHGRRGRRHSMNASWQEKVYFLAVNDGGKILLKVPYAV